MTILNLDANQLIIFYYVAREESVSLAAEKLCLTQPTITYHLKALEKYAGVKLFNIKKQRFCLTEAGKGLYKYSKAAWSQLNSADTYLHMLKETYICIGVSPLFHNIVTPVLTRMSKLHPEVNLQIVSTVTNKILEGVSDLEINLGIVLRTDYSDHNVKVQEISGKEKLVFVASPDSPIVKKPRVEWSDLENSMYIVGPQDSLVRSIITDKLKAAGVAKSPRFAVETLNVDCGKIFAQEGNGVGLWYIKDVEAEILAGKLKVLPLPEDIYVAVDMIISRDLDTIPAIMSELFSQIKNEFCKPSI